LPKTPARDDYFAQSFRFTPEQTAVIKEEAKRCGTPERWHKVRELFYAVYQRTPDERALYLGTKCADDPSLRSEVERLISSHEKANGFLEPTQTTLPTTEGQLILEPGQQQAFSLVLEPMALG
jgi:hypothetical protein